MPTYHDDKSLESIIESIVKSKLVDVEFKLNQQKTVLNDIAIRTTKNEKEIEIVKRNFTEIIEVDKNARETNEKIDLKSSEQSA